MLRNLAITFIFVLTTALALAAGASAMIRPEPPGPGAASLAARLASNSKVAGFTALGSPTIFIGTRWAGDPAALRAQLAAFGGAGSYATQPAAGSNVRVPGLQP